MPAALRTSISSEPSRRCSSMCSSKSDCGTSDLYRQPELRSAKGFLKGWLAVAKQSALKPIVKAAGTINNVNFPVDIHNPAGVGQAETFAAKLPTHDLPYGCLVPEGRDGLLLSGRNIAGSHEAHASYRVQQITMHIGIAAGTAAAACVRLSVQPRQLDPAAIQSQLGICA